MNKFKGFIEGLKEYFKDLLEDINNLTFKNFKEFLINRKILFISILMLVVIFIFAFGNSKSSKEVLLKDLEIAMNENKPDKIYKKIKVNGDSISKEELKPLTEYYSENQQQVTQIIKELKSSGKSSFFTLVTKKNLFSENYSLEIEPVSLKVNSNFDETKIFINENKIDSNNMKSDLIPGKHLIRGELSTDYGLLEAEDEIDVIENFEYNLNMPAINITLNSNFTDADVFINDKNINKKVKDVQRFGPVPLNKDINIHLEKEFPWGLIKSEKVKVDKLPNINIDINMVNDRLINDVDKSIETFYNSVFNALNKSDYNLIENSRENAKSKIYDSIRRESLFLKNNYDIKNLSMEIKSSEFYFVDEIYKGNIVINLNYSVGKKLLPFLDKNVEEMFLTNVEYENGNWIITDVQKFALEE